MEPNKKRVLIADDEMAIRRLLRRILTTEGFEVDEVSDGKEAQSKISEQEYDLYLFDFRMPLVGGKELYQWVQEKYPRSAVRVLFITGSPMGQETMTFLQSSGRQALSKPFTAEELKTRIRQTLESLD